jgi:general secretion pathway protein I
MCVVIPASSAGPLSRWRERVAGARAGSAGQLARDLFPRPLSRLRERVAGALHALAARTKRDGRVRAGGRTRPTVVKSHDAPILAPPFFGVCITPPPRAQRARLSSGWHPGRKSKSDRTASHLLSPSERRDKRGGSAVHLAGDLFRCPLSRWDKRAGSAGQLARNLFPRPLLSHRESRDKREAAGFTLLEVMIAIAVLGVAMLALLSLHDSNLQSVMRGQELSTASSLAQSLMTNAEMERIPMVGSTQGDFQRLFPGAYRNFKWQRTVEMSAMFPDIRKVQVTVFYGPRFRHNFSIVEFLHDPTPQIPNGGQVAPGSLGQSPAVGQTTH